MVVPVVVVGDVVARLFALHTLQVAFAAVPEVIVRVRYVRRCLGVERAVALCLVGIGARVAVEEVAVMHPYVVVALLQAKVVAFAAVAVHKSDVAHFHV